MYVCMYVCMYVRTGVGKGGNITLRAIGVSNFNEAMLTELLHIARVKPAVVQNRHDLLHTDW